MIYKIIKPSAHLQAFVKDYLLLHFTFDKNLPVPIKPFPASPQHCLVFYIRGNVTAIDPVTTKSQTFPLIAINGSITSRLDLIPTHDYSLLSICFHPGALSKFLRLPLTEFVNERVDAEAILNPEIGALRERMANASSYESIVQLAENYLWSRIKNLKTKFLPIDKVTQLISEKAEAMTVERMASEACLSTSQFERRFLQLTGITPKFFSRINRFYHAYQIKDSNPAIDWLSVALQTGYHDYQHMVKDFKQFSDTLPHSLLEAQAHSPERILGFR